MCDSLDGKRQASAECEVTPEMARAGYSEMLDWDSRDFPDPVMATDIFKAMIEAAPQDWFARHAACQLGRPSPLRKSQGSDGV